MKAFSMPVGFSVRCCHPNLYFIFFILVQILNDVITDLEGGEEVVGGELEGGTLATLFQDYVARQSEMKERKVVNSNFPY